MCNFIFTPFTPFCSSLIINFRCPVCKSKNIAKNLIVPNPIVEDARDEKCYLHTIYQYQCKKCKQVFKIEMFNNINEGLVQIKDADNIKITEFFDYTDECGHIHSYLAEVEYALNTIRDSNDERLQKLIYKTLYVNIITRLEVFLCNTISNLILNNKFPEMSEILKRNFIEYFKKDIHNNLLSDIANKDKETQNELIEKTLDKLNFHQLKKIKKLYHEIAGIEFPDTSSLGTKIQIRHDIVHKDQKTIKDDDVISLINEVTNFIEDIELQVSSCLLKELQKN